ncbi:MAG TPA: hypothetical protein VFI42_18690, partial [Thermomicrobiaceae bacterium]|nr:hypothetical protein [Thermomicrobiaceae bacterium]
MNEQRIRRELRRLAAREVTHTDLWPGVRVRLARRHELRRPGTGFARPAGSNERGGPAIDSEYTWSERDRPRGGAARWAALAAGAGSLVLLAVLLAGAFGGHKAAAPGATGVPGSLAIGSTPAATPNNTPTPTFAATVVPQVLTPPYATPATCPVTPFVTSTPFGNYYTSTWLGYGALFAGLDRAYGGHWYAGGLKVMWMRLQGGALSITGTRLDGPAPPLKADIPDGYGAAGIQVSEIDFPVAGCWSVTGSIGSAPEQQVHFVVYAYPTGCRESAWASDPATPQPCAPPQSTATPNLPESSIATRLSARIIPVNAQPISGYVYADLESPGTLHLSGTYDDAGLHLLWLPVQGTCASHDLNQAFGERFYGTSTTPGSSEESFDVRLPTAGKQPPYALLTFIDGGGPL